MFFFFIILNSSDRYSGIIGIVELVCVMMVFSIDMCVLLLCVVSLLWIDSIFLLRFFFVLLIELF